MNFWDKYLKVSNLHKSYVCLGLDTDLNLLPENVLNEENPIWEFNKEIIAATKSKVAAYKLNYAFYLSSGKKGLEALEKSLDAIPDYIPKILDVKVGDISNTMTHYAKAYFEYLKVDAITVNPLMGEDVITPLIEFPEKFFFVLAITSNQSASDFLKKNNLYKNISRKIKKWGHLHTGAVVGATNSEEIQIARSLMPKTLFLIPGIGTQGGSLDEVMKKAICSKDNPAILINSSRGIIHKSKDDDFVTVAVRETDKLREKINVSLV